MKTHFLKFFLLLTLALLPACGAAATTPTPVAGLTGRAPGAAALWPDMTLHVYLVNYYGDDPSKGVYVMDASSAPQSDLAADGSFSIANIPTGKYILAIGPDAGSSRFVGEGGKLRVLDLVAGQPVSLGDLNVMQ
jgi:hypothetical protein